MIPQFSIIKMRLLFLFDFWIIWIDLPPLLYMCNPKTPTSGGHYDLCSKNVFLILGCDDTIFQKKRCIFFFFLIIWIDPPALLYTCKPKTPTFVGHWDLCSKNIFLIFGCDDTNFTNKKGDFFYNFICPFPHMRISPKNTLPGVVDTSGWRK